MKRAGFEVDVARDGRQALAALEGAPPDLMLLDVMMPEFDGYEVCARVRERPEWSGTKIVMLTARGRDAERERGLKAGADAYVTKPFSTRELVEQVKRMLAEG
jgi:DNA-binding response OmpR family regulator